jgi:excisionase family DNA binding protein
MTSDDSRSPWLTAREAAARLRISTKTLYHEVGVGRLRAARIGGRRSLRFLPEWCDAYLEACATPVDVVPHMRFVRR